MWNLIFDAYILEPNSLEFIVPSMASCTCWHYNVALRHVAVLYKQLWLLIWNTKKKVSNSTLYTSNTSNYNNKTQLRFLDYMHNRGHAFNMHVR